LSQIKAGRSTCPKTEEPGIPARFLSALSYQPLIRPPSPQLLSRILADRD